MYKKPLFTDRGASLKPSWSKPSLRIKDQVREKGLQVVQSLQVVQLFCRII